MSTIIHLVIRVFIMFLTIVFTIGIWRETRKILKRRNEK